MACFTLLSAADFTFVCPKELEDAAKCYKEFQSEGAKVISISTDTAFAHKAWHNNSFAIEKITYPMASDPTGKICKAFNTYVEDEGLSLHATYIINSEGNANSIEVHNNSIGRNILETLRKLQAAKFVVEHKGKICPASWVLGKDTLTPNIDLVGKT